MKEEKIHILKPSINIKYKKIARYIQLKYQNTYTKFNISCNKYIDIKTLMLCIVNTLKPKVKNKYRLNIKYDEKQFIDGIIDVINNNTYWSRYKGTIDGKYLNKRPQ